MPILNYTTTVAPEKTISDIVGMLGSHGASRVSTTFDEAGAIAGVSFALRTGYGVREFELPVRTAGVLAVLAQQRKKNSRVQATPEQASRVAWRIAKDWLEAQLALVDAHLVQLDEVMLPYMLVDEGTTAYQQITARFAAVEAGGRG